MEDRSPQRDDTRGWGLFRASTQLAKRETSDATWDDTGHVMNAVSGVLGVFTGVVVGAWIGGQAGVIAGIVVGLFTIVATFFLAKLATAPVRHLQSVIAEQESHIAQLEEEKEADRLKAVHQYSELQRKQFSETQELQNQIDAYRHELMVERESNVPKLKVRASLPIVSREGAASVSRDGDPQGSLIAVRLWVTNVGPKRASLIGYRGRVFMLGSRKPLGLAPFPYQGFVSVERTGENASIINTSEGFEPRNVEPGATADGWAFFRLPDVWAEFWIEGATLTVSAVDHLDRDHDAEVGITENCMGVIKPDRSARK